MLVGFDESTAKHQKYMKKSKMKWPAITFDHREKLEDLIAIGETGFLPCTALMTKDGKLVSNKEAEVIAKLKAWVTPTGE